MKRLLFVLLLLLSAYSFANATTFPFKEVNSKYNIGICGGCVGYQKPISCAAIGVSATIKGIYVDLMGMPPSHEHVEKEEKWNDRKSITTHLGYQIPILKSFRIIPMVGYARVSKGVTDGNNWYTDSDGKVHNKYMEKDKVSGFDYGGIAVINIKSVNINLAVTDYALYGGIAIEF